MHAQLWEASINLHRSMVFGQITADPLYYFVYAPAMKSMKTKQSTHPLGRKALEWPTIQRVASEETTRKRTMRSARTLIHFYSNRRGEGIRWNRNLELAETRLNCPTDWACSKSASIPWDRSPGMHSFTHAATNATSGRGRGPTKVWEFPIIYKSHST